MACGIFSNSEGSSLGKGGKRANPVAIGICDGIYFPQRTSIVDKRWRLIARGLLQGGIVPSVPQMLQVERLVLGMRDAGPSCLCAAPQLPLAYRVGGVYFASVTEEGA